MTDLAPADDATRSCPRCGGQNDAMADVCAHCGERLEATTGREDERGDLEVVEVSRAVGALGYDAEFRVDGDMVHCSECGTPFRLDDGRIESAQPAQDTTSGGTEATVITCTCPSCGTHGHAVLGVPGVEETAGGTTGP